MSGFLSPASSPRARSHSSSAPERFIQRIRSEQENARRIATFYRFRRAGREAYQRSHWAQESNAVSERRRSNEHKEDSRISSSPYSDHSSMASAATSLFEPPSESPTALDEKSPPRPTRFNWRVLRHPRNVGGDSCKVGQLTEGVSYSVAGRQDQHFRYVPRELEGAHYCISPTSREAVQFSLSARCWVWLVIDRRLIEKSDPLAASGAASNFYAKHFEPFFDAVALGSGSEPDYFVLYKSSQPWKKDAIVQLPPFPESFKVSPIILAIRTDDALELPTDYESNELNGIEFQEMHSAQRLSGSLNVHAAHVRFRSRRPLSTPFEPEQRALMPFQLDPSHSSPHAVLLERRELSQRENVSSIALDSEQIAMLHSLSKDDLQEMCSNYGASRTQILRAYSKEDLVKLLRQMVEDQAPVQNRHSHSTQRSGSGTTSEQNLSSSHLGRSHMPLFEDSNETNERSDYAIRNANTIRIPSTQQQRRQQDQQGRRRQQLRARVLFDFIPGSSGQQVALSKSASEGTTIQILGLGKINSVTGKPDWVNGVNHLGQTGWFPFSYIEMLPSTCTSDEVRLLSEAERASSERASRIGFAGARRIIDHPNWK